MIIEEHNMKLSSLNHKTDTSQFKNYSKVTLPKMRPGVVLPMALFQCPRPDVSLGNGGSVNSGRRQDFENHSSPTVRVALKLFESFPNQNEISAHAAQLMMMATLSSFVSSGSSSLPRNVPRSSISLSSMPGSSVLSMSSLQVLEVHLLEWILSSGI